MGRRNMYIKVGTKGSILKEQLQIILDFIDHHNNWEGYFQEHEIQKLLDDDEIPGEELSIKFIFNEERNEYWAYLTNGGGARWTELWAEKYFPSLKLFNSSTWPYYQEEWEKWELYDLEDFCGINLFNYNPKNP